MPSRNFLWSIVLVWIFLGRSPLPAVAQESEKPILPNESDYVALEQGQNCSVLRAVIRNLESDYLEAMQQRKGYRLVVWQRRQELEACATREQVGLARDSQSQALLAETCRGEYQAWLQAGAHFRLLREDTDEAVASLKLLLGHARGQCARLAPQISPQFSKKASIMDADGKG